MGALSRFPILATGELLECLDSPSPTLQRSLRLALPVSSSQFTSLFMFGEYPNPVLFEALLEVDLAVIR
jgi:hypothetical protein